MGRDAKGPSLIAEAKVFLDSIRGKPVHSLTPATRLTKLGAEYVLKRTKRLEAYRRKNPEKNRTTALKWGEENAERRRINNRIATLRGALQRLENKEPSRHGTVDWSARRAAYADELAALLAKREALYGVPADSVSRPVPRTASD